MSSKVSLLIKFSTLASIPLLYRKREMPDCCGCRFKIFAVVKESSGGKNSWKPAYLVNRKYRK